MVLVNPGETVIRRQSEEASVTIPFKQSFGNIGLKPVTTGDDAENFNYCGCGWPNHMLLPRGTKEGSEYYVFVMISNYEDDSVGQEPD